MGITQFPIYQFPIFYYWFIGLLVVLDYSVLYGQNAEYFYDGLTVIHGRVAPFGNRRIAGL